MFVSLHDFQINTRNKIIKVEVQTQYEAYSLDANIFLSVPFSPFNIYRYFSFIMSLRDSV